MSKATSVTTRRRAAVLTTLALAGAIFPAGAIAASAGTVDTGGCTISSVGPVLYVDIVFPVIEVRCDSEQRRIRVTVSMTADGVEASSSSRDCRNTAACDLTIDAWVPDRPGDQQWCAIGTAWRQSNLIGSASSCESEPF